MTGRGTRILVTGGEYLGVLSAVRALAAAGYDPWVTAGDRGTYAARSRATRGSLLVPDPSEAPAGFVDCVAQAAREHGIAAVLPGTEPALLALAAHRDRLPADLPVGVPALEAIELALDKEALTALATEAGLGTIPTAVAGRAEVAERAAEVGYPVVVKPTRSEVLRAEGTLAHVGPRLARSEGDLADALEGVLGEKLLVQPFLDAKLGSVAGVAWDGRVVCSEHRLAERTWPVDVGTMAYAVTRPRDRELDRAVEALLASIGWSGIFQLQFLEHEGRPLALDLNPRIFASLALTVEAGLNLPAIWADLVLGRTPHVGDYRVGVAYRAEELDLRAVASAFAHGSRTEALRALLPRRGTVHAVFSWRDPRPVVTSVTKLPGKAARVTGSLATSKR